jgi:hypothetical protein
LGRGPRNGSRKERRRHLHVCSGEASCCVVRLGLLLAFRRRSGFYPGKRLFFLNPTKTVLAPHADF